VTQVSIARSAAAGKPLIRRLDQNPFASKAWIDQPGAPRALDRLLASGRITAEERELLSHFLEYGYLRMVLPDSRQAIQELRRDFDRLWREKPADLCYASQAPHLQPMSSSDEAHDRQPPYRIHEVQSHSAAARSLYLHPTLHRLAGLILGEAPVAIQSILFEYGSAQALHRDPVFVPIAVPGHLVAAWIALEDIDPAAGALTYIPKSHRFPPFEFRSGAYIFDPTTMGQQDLAREAAWLEAQMRAHDVQPELFTPGAGEALLWHSALYHGGGPILDRSRTRRSFVVHFSSRRHHRVAALTLKEPGANGESTMRIVATQKLMQQRGAVGFANPLAKSHFDWWPTLSNRVTSLLRRASP
jgi:phytanoyl-CoA hydroxylase